MSLKKLLLSAFFLSVLFASSAKMAKAQVCSNWKISGNTAIFPSTVSEKITIEYTVKAETITPGDKYIICTDKCQRWPGENSHVEGNLTSLDGTVDIEDKFANNVGSHTLHIRNQSIDGDVDVCTFGFRVDQVDPFASCKLKVNSTTDARGKEFTPNTTISISGESIPTGFGATHFVKVTGPGFSDQFEVVVNSAGSFPVFNINKRLSVGTYRAQLYGISGGNEYETFSTPTSCQTSFCIAHEGCQQIVIAPGTVEVKNICAGDKSGNCKTCFDSGDTWTALGCISTSTPTAFVTWFLGRAIFIATGIAFLLMVLGAIQILTSAGSPEQVKGGRELIVSALSGLIFIILSLFLLRLIGVDILQIPGFAK